MKWPLLSLFLLPLCFPRLAAAAPAAAKEEAIQAGDFKVGLEGAMPYRGEEKLETGNEPGRSFLRVTLPGERPLEGVRFKIAPVEGNRLMKITAKVRGSGMMGPMVQVANGWTRLPAIALSRQWKEIEIPKTLKAGKNSPILYFVSMPKEAIQQGAVFEIADLRVALEAPLPLADKAMKPRRFEAEDYTPAANVREEDGTACVPIRGSFATQAIPFPQTSRPVGVYARYLAASTADRLQLCTRRGEVKQAIREVQPPSTGWQWIAFPPLTAEETGDAITFEVWPQGDAAQPAALDALVLGTEEDLHAETLDAVR